MSWVGKQSSKFGLKILTVFAKKIFSKLKFLIYKLELLFIFRVKILSSHKSDIYYEPLIKFLHERKIFKLLISKTII